MAEKITSLKQGVETRQAGDMTFVNFHSGGIARTSKTPVTGWTQYEKKSQDGTVRNYWKLETPSLTGFVTGAKTWSKELDNGTVLSGLHIFIDCGDAGMFCLDINRKSDSDVLRRFISCGLNVDWEKMVQINGFLGEKERKVLFMRQMDEFEQEAVVIKPKYRERWVSDEVIKKIQKKEQLTEEELERLELNEDGTVNLKYPYIKQKFVPADQKLKWQFEAWDEFLDEQLNEYLLPAIKLAGEAYRNSRPVPQADGDSGDTVNFHNVTDSIPEFSGSDDADDIPF